MNRYTVTGPRRVAGVEPGGTVDLDPSEVNVEALVEAGHVAPYDPMTAPLSGIRVKPRRPAKAEEVQE